MDKLLSIIIPSYNMEKYLDKCIGSCIVSNDELLQQLEILVVNDGSKDRTSEIGHSWERNYPDVVRVIDKANGNYGSCVNGALPVIQGKFVKILDADDSFNTDEFEKFMRILMSVESTVDVIFSDFVEVDESNKIVNVREFSLTGEFGVGDLVTNKVFIAMHGVCYRVALLRNIGYHQLEGISYTDLLWIYMPIAQSTRCLSVKLKVYRYLLGRSGQTVSVESVEKNKWMLQKVLNEELFLYKRWQTLGNHSYLEFQISRIIAMLVRIAIYTNDAKWRKELLIFFSKCRRDFTFLVPTFRAFSIFTFLPIRFRYVNLMINHPSMTPYVIGIVRAYNWLRNKFVPRTC